MRLHEALGPPYTKKNDFFNEGILINGRRRLSKHAPRHLPPIFFFNRARFRRERADLVPFIWVLPLKTAKPQGGSKKYVGYTMHEKSSKRRLAQILPTYPPKN